MTVRSLESILAAIKTAEAGGTVLSVDYLRSLPSQASARHIDADTPGATTLLYTGVLPDGRPAYQLSAEVATSRPGMLTLSNLQVDVATLLK
jgi:hypothetical protein